MELNKKAIISALSKVRAHENVVVFKDSQTDGCLDILYCPKFTNVTLPCVSKMTVRVSGLEIDLFNDSHSEKLGNPILVFLNRFREALTGTRACVLKDGCVNGIQVKVKESDMSYPMLAMITKTYEKYSEKTDSEQDFQRVTMRKADYAYMVSECSKFITKDWNRYCMAGICFDFFNRGENYIRIAATDGKKLCVLKHKENLSKCPLNPETGQFIVPPAYLHVPRSDYDTVIIRLFKGLGQVLISTEDYCFEGLFACIEGSFPNYMKVIPEITEKTQWFTLCAASLRSAIDSVKSLMGQDRLVHLNAENPEHLNIIVADGLQTLKIEGTASRPMRLVA
jgi:hypothetical protein